MYRRNGCENKCIDSSMMALYGQNVSLNLCESIDRVVIQPKTCEAALRTVLCVSVCMHVCQMSNAAGCLNKILRTVVKLVIVILVIVRALLSSKRKAHFKICKRLGRNKILCLVSNVTVYIVMR
jgi:hypothetical protein